MLFCIHMNTTRAVGRHKNYATTKANPWLGVLAGARRAPRGGHRAAVLGLVVAILILARRLGVLAVWPRARTRSPQAGDVRLGRGCGSNNHGFSCWLTRVPLYKV